MNRARDQPRFYIGAAVAGPVAKVAPYRAATLAALLIPEAAAGLGECGEFDSGQPVVRFRPLLGIDIQGCSPTVTAMLRRGRSWVITLASALACKTAIYVLVWHFMQAIMGDALHSSRDALAHLFALGHAAARIYFLLFAETNHSYEDVLEAISWGRSFLPDSKLDRASQPL